MSKVKLLVCYHKPSFLLKDEVLVPIHVGRALAQKRMDHESENYKWLMEHLIGDDTGDNISEKNGSYNEMTSLYWAWKNYEELGNPEYIGLMHYRRHLINRPGEIEVVHFDNMDEEHYFDEINYSPEKMEELVDGCDFVTHIGKVNNVYKHYLENHRQEDLDLAFEIMYEKYPEYKKIAKEYFNGDYSNFCNMFIFKKEIFFDYCEWIFPILEEFERRVDTSEKRFFISERLTGVYIAKLMKEKNLKYKVVPISFVAENVRVPIVMPYNKDKEFQIATTITSLLHNKKDESEYTIYLIHNQTFADKDKNKFQYFEKKYKNVNIKFVKTDIGEDYYPIILPEIFPQLGKCIYLTEDVLVMNDLVEFYRTCSTDDYYVVGTPLKSYDIYDMKKKVRQSFLVMNLGRLRQHALYENAKKGIEKRQDGTELLNELCDYTIGYVPWYFETASSLELQNSNLFNKEKSRGNVQADAVWKPIMVYDTNKPWEELQGVYSLFWWEMAAKVPVSFKFCSYNEGMLETSFSEHQKEINEIGYLVKDVQLHSGADDWKSYSLFGKLKFYYDNNGFKNTVKYCWNKYVVRGN